MTFTCSICGVTRGSWENLQVHMRQVHTPDEQARADVTVTPQVWACPYCSMSYELEAAFANHIAKYCDAADKAWDRAVLSEITVMRTLSRIERELGFVAWLQEHGR